MMATELAHIARLMSERSIEEIEITTNGARYRLVAEGSPEPPAVPSGGPVPNASEVVTAHVPGRFRPRHPARARAEAEVGTDVRSGDVVGYLEAGALLLPVLATADGTVREVAAADGDLVGYASRLIAFDRR